MTVIPMAECSQCEQAIIWANVDGQITALDGDVHPAGSVVVRLDERGNVIGSRRWPGLKRRRHSLTCPKAAWRARASNGACWPT